LFEHENKQAATNVHTPHTPIDDRSIFWRAPKKFRIRYVFRVLLMIISGVFISVFINKDSTR
jgi:hypothetical protein